MFSFLKMKKEPDTPHLDEQYIKFRNLILSLEPDKFKSTEQRKTPDVWGVMVDIGDPEMFYTVIAIIDGTTSVYASSGASRVGFGDHPKIAKMSQDLLTMANKFTGDFSIVSDCPLPSKNMIKFYVFKQNETYMGECNLSVLESNTPIKVLFQSQNWTGVMATIAWSIISEIRVIKQELTR
jgi:hypothetical protein